MRKHLHDIDEIFRSAYQHFREEPSPEVWKKINLSLFKKEADSIKKRSVKWKRASLLLLLLLAGLILYETIIVRTGFGSRKKTEVITNIKPGNRIDQNLELKDPIKINQGKINDVGNEQATNKRSNDLNPRPENYATVFTQHIAPVFLAEEIKTDYSILFKTGPPPPPLFIDNSIQSKNNLTVQPGRKNSIEWTYTPFVSYEWAQYRIDSDLPAVNSIKQGNEHEPSFSTGILLSGQFMEKWMLQSGIVYSNATIDIAPQNIYAVQSPGGDYAYKYITSAGYGYIRPGFAASPALGDSLSTAEAEHTLRHITVPLEIKYKIKQSKFSIIPGAGIAVNFLTGTKVETEITNATNKETIIITKLTGTKNINWSLIADAEMQYKLNNKMSLNIRPAFRYAISSITSNDDFQTFPYAFGVGVGMTFKF